jgi:hypothetical protein
MARPPEFQPVAPRLEGRLMKEQITVLRRQSKTGALIVLGICDIV